MSMYAELLLRAQEYLREDLDSDDLVDYAIDCRSQLLTLGPVNHTTAMATLAVEVAYDCALIRLCANEDIGAVPTDFSRPAEGRRRFELELRSVGIDLTMATRGRKIRQV
jgi:hypothetical protein